jgi:hypothetical protein
MKAGLGKPDAKLKTATFNETAREGFLERIAIFQIRFSRSRSLILGMSLSQNRCTLLRDML